MKASDIRKGKVLMHDGKPCRVMDFQHRTPGNLRAFIQVRYRDLLSGNSFDTRLSSTDTVEEVRVDTREMQVLYREADGVIVMDISTYEQYTIDDETSGDEGKWLEPEMIFQAQWYDGRPIAIMLPSTLELEVTECNPPMRGATKQAGSKPATLSNGCVIQVPEFVEQGQRIKVNPREGEYLERVK
jgi:elongation factor P